MRNHAPAATGAGTIAACELQHCMLLPCLSWSARVVAYDTPCCAEELTPRVDDARRSQGVPATLRWHPLWHSRSDLLPSAGKSGSKRADIPYLPPTPTSPSIGKPDAKLIFLSDQEIAHRDLFSVRRPGRTCHTKLSGPHELLVLQLCHPRALTSVTHDPSRGR
jgi:hypothetical protein